MVVAQSTFFIASRSLSNVVHSMKVHDLSIFSDHCMLTAKLRLNSNLCYDENVYLDDTNLKCLAPDRFIWSESSKIKFKEIFSSPEIHQKIINLQNFTVSDVQSVDNFIDAISDVIVSAGDMTLPRKTFKIKKKKSHKINKKMV